MHQPSAVGTPLSVVWEGEKGSERALLTAKIVDDAAWKKVKEGVYKGFSIGVIPRVMRGKDVEVCSWWDTSLIDVGKDKDAKFTVFRVLGLDSDFSAAEGDVDLSGGVSGVERLAAGGDADLEGSDFSDISDLADVLDSSGLSDFSGQAEQGGLAGNAEHQRLQGELGAIQRQLEEKEQTIFALMKERDENQAEIARVQGLSEDALKRAEAAEGRVKELENMPRAQRPVVHAQSVPYGPGIGLAEPDAERRAELRRALNAIIGLEPTSDKREGDRRILEIQRIKRELARFE
jgi:hypothetical protein